MPQASTTTKSLQSIGRFLQEVGDFNKAAAEAHTEPGSVGGPTTHPVKQVDDFTEEAKEGFRSAENDADVKADQGPASVDNTPEGVADKKAEALSGKSESGDINPAGTAASDQLQIGTKKEPTGQDPSVETGSAKAEKEDPASAPAGQMGHSTSPARTNNSELDGLKYAELSLDQHMKVASDLANQVLVGISHLQKKAELEGDRHKLDTDGDGKIEGSDLAALRKKKDDKKDSDCDKEAADLAGQAGWELAGLLSGDFDKEAADALVENTLVDVISEANSDAEKVAEYLYSYEAEMENIKAAMGDMPEGIPPEAIGAGEAAPAGDEEMMAEAMMGGEEEAGGEAGELEEISAMLEQLGITPEELEAAMAAEGGGEAMGEEAMGEEAMGEEAMADEAAGMEVEAAAKQGSTGKTTRDYIQEVLERSRK